MHNDAMERRNLLNRLRTTLEPRPPLRRPWPATVDVDCGTSGRGQLRPRLKGATNTGHVHRAVVKVDPSLTIGNPATHMIEPGRSSKLTGT